MSCRARPRASPGQGKAVPKRAEICLARQPGLHGRGGKRPRVLYNVAVEKDPQRRALRAETVGLLVVAMVIVAIVLLWSCGSIDWYAR